MYIFCFVTPDFDIDCIMNCDSGLSLPYSLIIMVNILTHNIVDISYEVYRYGFLFNCTDSNSGTRSNDDPDLKLSS